MEKRFIHIAKKASFNENLQTKYANSIVFIKDTQEIFTHGTFYAIPETYKNKITSLESAVEALQAINAFTTISDGEHTASATGTAKTIKFTGNTYTTVTVGEDGVTIAGKDWSSEIAEAKAAGTGANSALEAYKETNDAAVKAAKDQADKGVNDAAAALAEAQKKVASVTSGSEGIVVNGTATAPTIALKLDNSGNVTLEETEDGLKASVEIEEVTVPVTGVKSGDKVLALNGTELTSTLSIKYDSDTKQIQLLGIDGAVIGTPIDATKFITDGMLEDVQYNPATHKISFTFNTDAGSKTIDDIDLSGLIDTYKEGLGIKFESESTATGAGQKISVEIDEAGDEGYLSVGVSGLKVSGVNKAIADKVKEAKDAVDEYTVNGKKISTNPTIGGADVTLTNYDKSDDASAVSTSDTINSAVSKLENQIDAVKATADAAVSNVTVTDGTYVKATVSGTTTKTIAINDSAIETLFAWEEIND